MGLAVAARLATPDTVVVLVESHERYGKETSSRNSEVIHAGLYYPKGSLKSVLCHEGRRLLYELCDRHGIGHRKTGKLVVAAQPDEVGALEHLLTTAASTGAEGLMLLDGAGAVARVQGLRAEAALWSPETGIIDSEGLMHYYKTRAEERGALLIFGATVTGVQGRGDYFLDLNGGKEQLAAAVVINCAGLHSDKVAALAGLDVDAAGYRLHWCKGSYFRCRRPLPNRHLVYPMPAHHGLGVHMTIDMAGRCRFGPDTEFVDSLDYEVDPGRACAFRNAIARYLPEVELADLSPDMAGIRPKLSGPKDGFRDFVIVEESSRGLPGWINLIGIESPGLTASPAIAERVAGMLGLTSASS